MCIIPFVKEALVFDNEKLFITMQIIIYLKETTPFISAGSFLRNVNIQKNLINFKSYKNLYCSLECSFVNS